MPHSTKNTAHGPDAGADNPNPSDRNEALRRMLVKARQAVLDSIRAELSTALSDDSLNEMQTALDDGDWAQIDQSQQVNIKKLESLKARRIMLDQSIAKLREGTYGLCEDCQEEISPSRLKVMPFALRCIDCQEEEEERSRSTHEEPDFSY